MAKLEGLTWRPAWITHMGCTKGCLEHLGSDISWGWLYGASGLAFVINVHEVLCPSGPTAWHGEVNLRDLLPNAGVLDGIYLAFKGSDDFAEKQRGAFEFVKAAIDAGEPCYGWELDIPEYYVINGYDETGYLYDGCGSGQMPYDKLADTGIGVLSVHKIGLGAAADDAKTVADACRYGVKFGTDGCEWVFDKYRSGPAAFELWAEALESGKASEDGHGYNARCWGECRNKAVEFLKEARERLAGRCDALFDEAIEHYSAVAAGLDRINEMRPFNGPKNGFEGKFTDPESAAIIRKAGAAEKNGIAALGNLAHGLEA